MTHQVPTTRFLRLSLFGDAAASGAMGLLMAFAAGPLSALLGLPQALLLGAGLFLLPYASFVAWLGHRASNPARAIWAVIVMNGLWVAESFVLLFAWLQPTALGTAFVIVQAAAVAGFAELQFVALRNARRHDPAAA